MVTDPQKFLRARMLTPALISNYGLAPGKAAQPRAPALRRTATYRAIVCALGLGAGVAQANDPIDLDVLGAGGFRMDGIDAGDRSGRSVSGAGDVNGDGLDDVIVGAPYANPAGDTRAGESYVVFGKADSNPVVLANLETDQRGFRIDGIDPYDSSGRSVSGAGDVDGDGLDDVIVGAYAADPDGNSRAGESYVVFGKADSAPIDLGALGSGGLRIDGIDANDESGRPVSGAGDVNGDGLADVIVGAEEADPDGNFSAGESYVVFGKADSVPVELASLGSGGFRIDGIDGGDRSGTSVAGAGDVNGDGLADVIVGAPGADPDGNVSAGESYLVYGKTNSAPVDLAALGSGGFRIDGIDGGDKSGTSVSGAGDVNGDGLDDLIVGADAADPRGNPEAGESYVVFGPSPMTGPVFFTDRERFLGATGATAASAPYSAVSRPPEPFQSGQVTFDAIAPSSLVFGNFPADFPADNDIELAINDKEDIDIAMADGFTFAMGIDFDDASGGDTPSTFDVTVKAGDTTLGRFWFRTDQLPDQDYLGVWAQAP